MSAPVERPAPIAHAVIAPIRDRRSGWAFSETPVPSALLSSVFEAARWAPSSWNDQPWRFVVGDLQRSAAVHAVLAESLVEGNRVWASRAPVLISCWAVGRFRHDDSPNRFALHDLGQAVALLQLQATAVGLRSHAMGGYDAERVRALCVLPGDWLPGAIIALGFPGSPTDLADSVLQEKEESGLRTRRTLSELVVCGSDSVPDWLSSNG